MHPPDHPSDRSSDHPQGEGKSRPLMQAAPDAFADFDLHVEARRFLWLVALVLALILGVVANLLR